MAHRTDNFGSHWLAFLVGALIVVAAMGVYLFYASQTLDSIRTADARLIPPAQLEPAAPDAPLPVSPLDRPKG